MGVNLTGEAAVMEGAIATFSGKTIHPLDPSPDDIYIVDIAHALSNSCRFTGHVRTFYSVAQHCVLCSYWVPDALALTALLHDASEAYLSDIARPIKQQPEFGDVYKRYEEGLEAAIAERFGLVYPYPSEIKTADNILLRTEQRDLMPDILRHDDGEYLEEAIYPWTPTDAEFAYLVTYECLTEGHVQDEYVLEEYERIISQGN